MKNLKSYEIRQMWLDFFKSKGHDVVPSASLIPVNDPTLLWINAGVAPLKKYFDGREIPKNRRLTNAQKSIRTNDIDNVGKTARHHTFFEMLGNFSIGDYFREEALTWAYELLTSKEWFDIDINKLYFTVYQNDDVTAKKWISLGVPKDHIIPLEGNFWEIGEGPCGPDTEIFFDRGVKYDKDNIGIDLLKNDMENDRYIEIWNIVFSQYNSTVGLPRSEYPELPSKNIDTGCGLERLACIMQDADTNYDTDLFMPIIRATEEITKVKYEGQMAFKVIADHLRSVTFACSDGAILSNEGRGYVLRRILRRAVRYGKKLGMNEPFLYKLVHVVVTNMNNFYTYLNDKEENVTKIVKTEEEKFLQTLESGEKKLLDYINANQENKVITKEVAFQLYDTFGFPLELTIEVSEENGFTVDVEGFNEELQNQKQRARNARKVDQSMNTQNEDMMNYTDPVEFVGYDELVTNSKVAAIFKDGSRCDSGDGQVVLVFDRTPFYGESGGQIGDKGQMILNGKTFNVINTIKLPNNQQASLVELGDDIVSVGDNVELRVDSLYRQSITKNHSGTHLLNEALRQVLGGHVFQQGSLVTNNYLRFDFNNYTLPTNEQLLEIEKIVNQEIAKNHKVNISQMPIDEAKKLGVQAVFGEKYGDIVRVVDMDFSKELCGGCHVQKTGDIQALAVLSVESKGSGIFRIEAATGDKVLEMIDNTLSKVNEEIAQLRTSIKTIIDKAASENIDLEYQEIGQSSITPSYATIIEKRNELALLREATKELEKKYNKFKKQMNTIDINDYLDRVQVINGISVIVTSVSNLEVDQVKDLADRLADKLKPSVIFIANVLDGKVVFVCKNTTEALNAGLLVKQAAIACLGNGGGRRDFAQAGGKDVSKVNQALEEVLATIGTSL